MGPTETVVDWWNWAINLSCNKSQLQRVSSTIAGTTIRERRLAFFGKSHFFSHGRGKDFSEEEEVAVSGPVYEKLGKNARNYLNTVLYIFVFQIILPFCLIKCRIVLNALGSTKWSFSL